MRTIAIDDPGVCLSDTRASCAKTAERINVLFGVEVPIPHGEGEGIRCGLCQITLVTRFVYVYGLISQDSVFVLFDG